MELLSYLKSPVILLGLAALGLAVHKLAVWNKFRHIPGPPLAGFTNFPMSKALYTYTAESWYREMSEKYGPVVRIGPKVILTSSPEIWIRANKDKRYRKDEWMYHTVRFEYRRDGIFSQTDDEKHSARRKQLTPGYSGRENHELEGTIDRLVESFIDLLRSKYTSTSDHVNCFDMSPKIQYFTLDVIGAIAFGKPFGLLATDSDPHEYLKATEEGLRILQNVVAFGLHWIMQAPIVGPLLQPSVNDSKGFGKMMFKAWAIVDERAANPTDKRSDMLASFIRNGLVGADLRTEVMGQIIAGSDTTSAAIRIIILHIALNPRVHKKLQREIDETEVPEGQLITYAQVKALPYLQAVLRESIRMLPPVSNYFPRNVPPAGDTVPVGDGKTMLIPGGAMIGPSTFAMNHDKDVFAPDAEGFRPERWLESDQPKLDRMRQINDLIFSSGRFGCLGKPVAWIEMSKITFELLRNFDIATTRPTKPFDGQVVLGLWNIKDMWMQITARDRI